MTKPRIVLSFGDGVYAFALYGAQLEELQEKTDAGPMELYRRLLGGTWRAEDARETIRLGLIGGGEGWVGAVLGEDGEPEGGRPIEVTPQAALRLVHRYVNTYAAPAFDPDDPASASAGPLPWGVSAVLASQVLGAGLMGKVDEPLGKKGPGEEAEEPSRSPTESSDGLQSSQASRIEA